MSHSLDILNHWKPAAAHLSAARLVRHLAWGGLTLVPLLLLAGCGHSDSPQIRLFNASPGYASLNVWVGASATTPLIADIPTGTLSSYEPVSSGANTVYFTTGANTQSGAVAAENETFSNREHRTFVTYGNAGQFAEYEINENEAAPSGGYASVEVLNTAADSGGLDVYLTSSASLSGASPSFSDVAGGQTTAFSSISSGTYELSVTGTGKSSDVRLQVPSVTLKTQEVATIIITESAGGYLVNAYVLPQQGSLTTELNPDARIRAVVGVNSGSTVSAAVGSTALISNAPANTVGAYQFVPVATQTVSVSVNGSAVASAAQPLAAGQDYTLLIYQTSSGIQENWLVDINRLPVSGDASIRLVHAMSGLTDPISLAVDSVPVASGVSQGEASGYDSSVAATTAGALSVTDTTTSQPVYSQSPVTLSSQGVYTLFMFGSAAAPTGVLNEDR